MIQDGWWWDRSSDPKEWNNNKNLKEIKWWTAAVAATKDNGDLFKQRHPLGATSPHLTLQRNATQSHPTEYHFTRAVDDYSQIMAIHKLNCLRLQQSTEIKKAFLLNGHPRSHPLDPFSLWLSIFPPWSYLILNPGPFISTGCCCPLPLHYKHFTFAHLINCYRFAFAFTVMVKL